MKHHDRWYALERTRPRIDRVGAGPALFCFLLAAGMALAWWGC